MPNSKLLVIVPLLIVSVLSTQTTGLVPYTRSLWDMMINDNIFPYDDPFRILEQTPMTIPRPSGEDHHTLALARADWKETPAAHVIELNVPGMTKEDVRVEVEENRVLRISGERKPERESESDGNGEKWHRLERIRNGKFWRRFRMPGNADLDRIRARLENGVLRITVPKLAEEKRRQPKVIGIEEDENVNVGSASAGEDIKAAKADL